jgi:hypothetical protein
VTLWSAAMFDSSYELTLTPTIGSDGNMMDTQLMKDAMYVMET